MRPIDFVLDPLIYAVGVLLYVLCLSVAIFIFFLTLIPCPELFAPFSAWNKWRKRRRDSIRF